MRFIAVRIAWLGIAMAATAAAPACAPVERGTVAVARVRVDTVGITPDVRGETIRVDPEEAAERALIGGAGGRRARRRLSAPPHRPIRPSAPLSGDRRGRLSAVPSASRRRGRYPVTPRSRSRPRLSSPDFMTLGLRAMRRRRTGCRCRRPHPSGARNSGQGSRPATSRRPPAARSRSRPRRPPRCNGRYGGRRGLPASPVAWPARCRLARCPGRRL